MTDERVRVLLKEYRHLKNAGEPLPTEWESFTGFAASADAAFTVASTLRPASLLKAVKVNPELPWSRENLGFVASRPCLHSAKARKVEYEGELVSVATLARRYGVSEYAVKRRLRNGLTVEAALSETRGGRRS